MGTFQAEIYSHSVPFISENVTIYIKYDDAQQKHFFSL